LLDPDAAIPGPAIPNGSYRCRVIKLGARDPGNLDFVTYPPFACRVHAQRTLQRLTKLSGSQRYVGLIFPGDAIRKLFLGTLVLGDEIRALQYRQDEQRDVAGYVERIGPNANGTAAVFSTYIPGAQANDIALDSAGNIYLGGAASVNFAATAGAYNSPQMGSDTMVMKLNPAGNAIVYAARVGGDGDDYINGIAVDAQGNVSATGTLYRYGAGATRKFPTVTLLLFVGL
jgi:hypothetical protein